MTEPKQRPARGHPAIATGFLAVAKNVDTGTALVTKANVAKFANADARRHHPPDERASPGVRDRRRGLTVLRQESDGDDDRLPPAFLEPRAGADAVDDRPSTRSIARDFEPSDLRPLLDACGIDRTVLVQSACTDSDTDSMFEQACRARWIGAVTAWVDLLSPDTSRVATRRARSRSRSCEGFRHLIHEEPDPHWILQAGVLESLAARGGDGASMLELPCVFPRHLGDRAGARAELPGPDDRDRPSRQAAARHRADGRVGDASCTLRRQLRTCPRRSRV